jgi:hypothetical protein
MFCRVIEPGAVQSRMIRTSIAFCVLAASLAITPAFAQTEPDVALPLSARDRIKADRAKDLQDQKLDTKRPWDKPKPDAVLPAPPSASAPSAR